MGIASWSSAEESALHVGAGIDCNAMIKLHKQRLKKSCDTNWRRMYDVHLHVTPEVSHVIHGTHALYGSMIGIETHVMHEQLM